MLGTLLVIGIAGSTVSYGTFATFTASTTNAGNTFSTGTLVLSNTKGATTCLSTGGGSTDTNANATGCPTAFTATVAKPGDNASGNLVLKNEGTIAGSALSVYTPAACSNTNDAGTYHGTGNPCSAIQFYIQEYSDAGFTTASACLYGVGTTTCAFDPTKTLATFSTAYPSSAAALGTGAIAAGASRYIKLAVLLPTSADNSYQGRVASVDFTWLVVQ